MWITRTSINQPVFATMVMLAIVVMVAIAEPGFLTANNLVGIVRQVAIMAPTEWTYLDYYQTRDTLTEVRQVLGLNYQ